MHFGASDDHTARTAFDYAKIQIRIGLFMRWKTSIAFGIGHGTIHRQVIVLTVDDKILKPPEIIGSALLINIIGCAVYSIHGIHANTALEAGSRFLPKKPLHFDFTDQIIAVLMKMSKAVDRPSGEMGNSGHQFTAVRVKSKIIGHFHRV